MVKTSSTHLKAHLGKFMRAVRDGEEVIVTDRDRPVARIIPFREETPDIARRELIDARDPTAPPLGEVVPAAIRYKGPSTSELLREDRERR